jgi:hypothetical protein
MARSAECPAGKASVPKVTEGSFRSCECRGHGGWEIRIRRNSHHEQRSVENDIRIDRPHACCICCVSMLLNLGSLRALVDQVSGNPALVMLSGIMMFVAGLLLYALTISGRPVGRCL